MEAKITAYPNGHDSTGIPEVSGAPVTRIPEETEASATPDPQIIRESEAPESPSEPIQTEQLYLSIENVSTDLNAATRLLSLCLENADQAIQAHREQDSIEADDAIQRLQGILPELFCCRTLGDGFGIIVNGLMCAFQNLSGVPLTRAQAEKVRQILVKLRSEPFLSVDNAVEALQDLEQFELVIEPPEFSYLADMLNE